MLREDPYKYLFGNNVKDRDRQGSGRIRNLKLAPFTHQKVVKKKQSYRIP